MFPPSATHSLDIEAVSGLLGSVSIACWVVVFSPQIIENFRRSSADGLSIEFIIIWLAGDVFNILGAVLQGVLPTMIVLAIYYTFADVLLMGQCFYYRGFTFRDPRPDKPSDTVDEAPTERTPLAPNPHPDGTPPDAADLEPNARTRSQSSFRERFTGLDSTQLSPANPMHPPPKDAADLDVLKPSQPRSWPQAVLFNSTAVVLVALAGVAGYYLSPAARDARFREDAPAHAHEASALHFNLWGQIFGYVCAALYLGSRVPQLLLNRRRRSTDGLNALFFLFACVGNLTYVLSICAFAPRCRGSHGDHGRLPDSGACAPPEARARYARYLLVNLSWLIGSLGTLFLDLAVFVQFFMYRGNGARVAVLEEDGPRTAQGEGRGREPVVD